MLYNSFIIIEIFSLTEQNNDPMELCSLLVTLDLLVVVDAVLHVAEISMFLQVVAIFT